MPSLSFTDQAKTLTQVLAEPTEVFTNCRQVSISRKLCDGNWFNNYEAIATNSHVTLPAGEYSFTASMAGCSNGCWLCLLPVPATSTNADIINTVASCFKDPVTNTNRKGFLVITNGDVAGAARLFQDGSPVPTNYVFEEDCC